MCLATARALVNGLPGAGKTTLARRARYLERAADRHPIHRDTIVDTNERFALWAPYAKPIGVGTIHRVDTSTPVDVAALAQRIRSAAIRPARF